LWPGSAWTSRIGTSTIATSSSSGASAAPRAGAGPHGRSCALSAGDAVQNFLSAHGHETALVTTTAWQRLKYAFWGVHLFVLLQYDWKIFFTFLTGVLALFYLATIAYKLVVVLASVVWPGEFRVSRDEMDLLDDEDLPVYTVLIPLYREAAIVDLIVESVKSIEYPQDKLDVILLLEEDDKETQKALSGAELPPCVRRLVVPEGRPKTKPRACDYGLDVARGEYLVIFDAEDRPEADQLKKAVVAFRSLPEKVICLQAKLNYYNPRQNWLTKWFTLEYTTWFDLFLPGLNRLRVPIPLGGTSNHFKTSALRKVGGWDPFNVAEDCDLGMRLHKAGFRTRVLDSTTWEEANSRLGNWIRQRSRWVKGYIQTHLVHSRETLSGFRILVVLALAAWMIYGLGGAGRHLASYLATRSEAEERLASDAVVRELVVAGIAGGALALWGFLKRSWRFGLLGNASFHLTVGGLSLSLLLNPIFWAVGIAWLFLRWSIWYPTTYLDDAGLQINYWSVASHWFWWIAVALLAANGVFILIHLIACAKRRLWELSGYALFVPLYWVLISIGAWRGFLQLFTRAHYWDKTDHGLSGGPGGVGSTAYAAAPGSPAPGATGRQARARKSGEPEETDEPDEPSAGFAG
jgi:cellulose synthase/poly-beta-1,6-N-acetylglucosamine synthase-like glycosyltransferase